MNGSGSIKVTSYLEAYCSKYSPSQPPQLLSLIYFLGSGYPGSLLGLVDNGKTVHLINLDFSKTLHYHKYDNLRSKLEKYGLAQSLY